MKGLIQWLNRAYPYDDPTWKKIRSGLMISLFVFLFLLIFQPFGLDGNIPNKVWILLGYGGVTMLAYVVVGFLVPGIAPKLFRDESWKVWKELLMQVSTVALIGVGNFFYTASLGYAHWSMANVFGFLFYTFIIGIFPITLGVLATQIRLLKRHEETSHVINDSIDRQQLPGEGNKPEGQVHLVNEEGKSELSLAVSALLFLAAADNYVEVHYVEMGEVRKHLIRSSLKRMGDTLPEGHFFRCHRSFIVNLQRVTHAEGNSAGLRLAIDGYEGTVPVSRSKAQPFQAQFSKLP